MEESISWESGWCLAPIRDFIALWYYSSEKEAIGRVRVVELLKIAVRKDFS